MDSQNDPLKTYKCSKGVIAVTVAGGLFFLIWDILLVLGARKFDGLFIALFILGIGFLAYAPYLAAHSLSIQGNTWRVRNVTIDITQLSEVKLSWRSRYRSSVYKLIAKDGSEIILRMIFTKSDGLKVNTLLKSAIAATNATVSDRARFNMRLREGM